MNKLNSHFDFNHDCGLPPSVTHRSCPPTAPVELSALCEQASSATTHVPCPAVFDRGVSFGSACRFLSLFKCVFAGLLGLGYQPACTPSLQRVGWSSEPTKAHYLFFIFTHKVSERASERS